MLDYVYINGNVYSCHKAIEILMNRDEEETTIMVIIMVLVKVCKLLWTKLDTTKYHCSPIYKTISWIFKYTIFYLCSIKQNKKKINLLIFPSVLKHPTVLLNHEISVFLNRLFSKISIASTLLFFESRLFIYRQIGTRISVTKRSLSRKQQKSDDGQLRPPDKKPGQLSTS